jgi:serine/threonine-protein kinase
MSLPNTDRNLLFGILALQMDFIERDELVAAMNAWILDKARPLGQIMVEQGSLRPDKRDLLEALVKAHLEEHGGDARKSLGAVATTGSVCQELRQIDDPDVQATLNPVSPSQMEQDGEITGLYAPTAANSTGTRFHVLRPHAQGGLGQVSVAYDVELDREVALKEIQARFAGQPANVSRFLLEAKVTGSLEHPGIVPVYGLGAYSDGRPYYAMRFVRGDNLKDAIARFHKDEARMQPGDRILGLRHLLGRFLDVCNALEYAHSRGVLHRDLKPGNILLGKYGETLVVDWGLAKVLNRAEEENTEGLLPNPLGDDSALTQAGTTLGTPAYMSPEQAAGRVDLMGPRSDVYSLGATLYTLLTGQAPFTAEDRVELRHKVQRGDFPRPRERKRGVAPPLEAVCLKAMALKPEDRYASPHELAADLERWLADEPVSCHREPWAARLSRWGRKHRPIVAAAVVLLLTVVVALSVSAVLIRREQKWTEEARQEEARQRVRAEENGERAQENFRKARKAVDEYLTYVSESKLLDSPLPGLQPLRKDLLEGALKYYEEFARQYQNDPTLRADLAQAYYRVGKIQLEIGTAADALQSYEKAISLWQALAAENPADRDHRLGSGKALTALGLIQVKQPGQRDRGVASLKEARTLLEGLVQEQPTNPDCRAALASNYIYLSSVLSANTAEITTPEEFDLTQKALAIFQELARADPKYRAEAASAAMNLGFDYTRLKRSVPALRYHQQALALLEELSREKPPEAWLRREIARGYLNIGYLHLTVTRKNPDALKNFDQGRVIMEQLARENPSVSSFHERHGDLCQMCATALLRLGQREKALELATQAVEILKQAALEQDSAKIPWISRGEAYQVLGGALSSLNRSQEAKEAYQQAFEAWMGEGQVVPPSRLPRIRTSNVLQNPGKAWPPDQLIHNWQSVGQLYENALRTGRDTSPLARRHLVWALGGLGDAYRDARQNVEAASAYHRVIEAWQKEARHDTSDSGTVRTVVHASLELARLRLAEGRSAEAKDLLVGAQDLLALGRASALEDFERARLNMLFASLAGAGKTERTREEEAEHRRYSEAAIESLRRAGPTLPQAATKIRNEPLLALLHGREDFRELLAELDAKEKFLKEWPSRIKQAQEWVKQGDHGRAATEASSLARSPYSSGVHWSAVADVYSDCAQAARQDDTLLPVERDKGAHAYADEGTRQLLRFREYVQANNRSSGRNYELARVNARLAFLAGSSGVTLTEKGDADSPSFADEAVAVLRRFLDEFSLGSSILKGDKIWSPLRQRPDFQELEAHAEAATQEARRFRKAQELAWEDKHAAAAAEIAGVSESTFTTTSTLYQSARVCSLCVAAVRRDEKLEPEEREKLARLYSDRAVEFFRKAVARGLKASGRFVLGEGISTLITTSDGRSNPVLPRNGAVASEEVDFNPIRDREDFQQLLADWKGKGPK